MKPKSVNILLDSGVEFYQYAGINYATFDQNGHPNQIIGP